MDWADVVFVVALAAPLGGLGAALPGGDGRRPWLEAGALLGAGAAVLVLLTGEAPAALGLEPDQLALAALAGAALIAAVTGDALTLLAVPIVGVGTSTGASATSSTVGAVVAVGLVGAVAAAAGELTPIRAGALGIGLALAGAGIGAGDGGAGPVLAAGGLVMVVVVAAAPGGLAGLAVPPALVLALRNLPFAQDDALVVAAVLATAAAAAMVLLPSGRPGRGRPAGGPGAVNLAGVVAAWAVAAATAGSGAAAEGAPGLLAAAAVLGVALPAVAICGLPGAAALAGGLVAHGGASAAAAGLLALATVVALAAAAGRGAGAPSGARRPAPALLSVGVVAVLAGWLLLWPDSWSWASAGDLDPWSSGAAVAVAAGAAGAGWLLVSARRAPPLASPGRLLRALARPRTRPVPVATRRRALGAAVMVVLGAVAAASVGFGDSPDAFRDPGTPGMHVVPDDGSPSSPLLR